MPGNGSGAIYRWVIGILLGVLFFGSGWIASSAQMDDFIQENRTRITVNESKIAAIEKNMDKINEKLDLILLRMRDE